MRLHKFATIALALGIVAALATPVVSRAVPITSFSIESIGTQIGLGESDLKATVINIIRLILGLMTLIAVTMIIYGGFRWLTAAGNEENVEKAKKIISAAVFGLIVILLAWAIVIFVARTTANVTVNG